MSKATKTSGAIAWMASHSVAANLLMILFIVGGLIVSTQVEQEVFPEFTTDRISVRVPYPGASPEEVEQGIVLAIEDVVQGVDGVKEVISNAFEGRANIQIELLTGTDENRTLQDVKNEIDSIQSFPEDAEEPIVSLVAARRRVLSLMVYGEQPEDVLRDLAEEVRSELLQKSNITIVELSGTPRLEIAIEIPRSYLRAYNLTLSQVAQKIRTTAFELPGGAVRTEGGEVLLRTEERRDFAREYADIAVVFQPDGSHLLLGEIAHIKDTFAETDQEAYYNGHTAIRVNVFRIGDETPQEISAAVKEYIAQKLPKLPSSVGLAVWRDTSKIYQDRIQLLLENAFLGLVLVLLLLGLFLDPKLAFWVTLGIPISVLGSFLFIPFTDASINMISLFAFIVTLGIVVDDAVVVGENIYEKRQQGVSFLQAAIEGAQEIAAPVTFAILTNIAAFFPLFFVPGSTGKLFFQIPAVVVAVFFVSLIESLFVLPAHLAHEEKKTLFWRIIGYPQFYFSKFLHWFTQNLFTPFLKRVLSYRYLTMAVAAALLILMAGVVLGGRITFTFLPQIDSDVVTAQANLPFGAPLHEARRVKDDLIAALNKTLASLDEQKLVQGVYAQIGSSLQGFGPGISNPEAGGSHLVGVQAFLVSAKNRKIAGSDFATKWRSFCSNIEGLESLTFNAETGGGGEAPIQVELSHQSRETIEAAAKELADKLDTYGGVIDIDDGVTEGKPQMNFEIKPEAQSLGIQALDLATQIRGAFYGIEALRQQRGRHEIKVMVRFPRKQRETYYTVEDMVVHTPQGGEIPLLEAAHLEEGYSYTEIIRRNGQRVISVTADVNPEVSNANKILAQLEEKELKTILEKYPGLTYSLEGEQASQRESLSALALGMMLALIVVYGLLAISFHSYIQPVIIMASIPFGAIGAIIGHFLLGFGLSIISIFGLIALSGVVINDSLVLIVTANRLRTAGSNALQAVSRASIRRLRPILLTSLTTFLGLFPMIMETSVQARFLIPMAISLGFGVLFATGIILLLVPSIYLGLEDIRQAVMWLRSLSQQEEKNQ